MHHGPPSTSVELWFMDPGYNHHLVKNASNIAATNISSWSEVDAKLRHSLDPKLLLLSIMLNLLQDQD